MANNESSSHDLPARHTSASPGANLSDPSLVAATSTSQSSFNQAAIDYGASQSLFPDQTYAPVDPSSLSFDSQSGSFPTFDLNSSAVSDPSFDPVLFPTTATLPPYIDSLDSGLIGSELPQPSLQDSESMTMTTLFQPSGPSPHASPSLGHGPFPTPPPSHSRNNSLAPSNVPYGQLQGNEWAGGVAFQGHRRSYSDAHSDISSAQQSPFLPAADNFDQPLDHSPNLGAQNDPQMFDLMGIGQVSLSESAPAYISPAHSPHISPRLGPVPHSPQFPHENVTLVSTMPTTMVSQYDVQANNMYPGEPFPNLNKPVDKLDHTGHADAMSPPEINIQFAPPSRQASFETQQGKPVKDGSALSPPDRASRGRSTSDPSSSRGSTPQRDTLSPHSAGVGSRSPSPTAKNRRSSTSSMPNRDYILDLADPTRPTSNNSDPSSGSAKRTQKHPATFQCSLCPKRFTRAYNLRSHLRTHTDERPFICGHCGKAFARQHDRKRHEGLHSGEKKFVCRGSLKDGNNWGCGRRFARADALGRHFRSEAGRMCIKPLMDEEALERMQAEGGAAMGIMPMMQQGQPMMQQPFVFNAPPPGFEGAIPITTHQGMPMRLPQALLAQYPTLGGIWETLPVNQDEAVEEVNPRNSFSSQGEFEEDEFGQRGAFGWASDVGP